VHAAHAPEPARPFRYRPETLARSFAPPSRADPAEISPAVFSAGADEAGPEGPESDVVAAVVDMNSGIRRGGVRESPNRSPWPSHSDEQGRRAAFSRLRYWRYRDATQTGRGGASWLTVLGHAKDSLWSIDLFRCESAILRIHWVLVVMDNSRVALWVLAWHRGAVDGVGLCGMFTERRMVTPTE